MDTAAIKDFQVSARFPSKAILALIALAMFTVFITWRARILEVTLQEQSEEPELVGRLAPAFSATTLDGHTVSLGDFRGQKNVVVTFWASWCGPCRLELAGLTRFYQRNHSDASDFEILAVSIDEDTRNATDFASAQKLNFPVLLDTGQKVADAYGVNSIPTMFIIDKNGTIKYGHTGYEMTQEFQLSRELGIKEKESN